MSGPGSGKRVVIAMSGGVDSSVAAALLKEQGWDVIGVSMQLRDLSPSPDGIAEFGSCCSLDDLHDARRVAEQLDIPFYLVNLEEEFQRLVVEDFAAEYRRGRTPNPCVRCNERIKFDILMAKARAIQADYLATGHYARVERTEQGRYLLYKGLDSSKDQSYFLFTLTQAQLSRTLFPLGGMTKPQVREIAARLQLRVAEKGESQEICFVPDNDYARFLEELAEPLGGAGNIVDRDGRLLGRHRGIHRYTIGQRRGLGIAHSEPLYVIGLDTVNNRVVAGPLEQLYSSGLLACEINWIDRPVSTDSVTCKIRYRHQPIACTLEHLNDTTARVLFAAPEKSVTPGQAVVFYREDQVLGGGWIEGPL